jgi:serine/threonine protein kinase/Tol biopolymer transport system component
LSLTPGSRIGPYEIGARIGVGGMGEVYRATDTNLGRRVAIKILPDTFAHDLERLARFEREAKTLASLNHSNIGQIYGLEKADGLRALVMELIEGPDLAQRISRGPIPLDEALTIARQVADALESAHEKGIVHRDLKPSNIKVRDDGTVKVIDFGLAKVLDSPLSSPDRSHSPTLTSPVMTQTGVILGTAVYMSPEQARGQTVDKRTDIWAFGCVLFEMLTGRASFGGDTVSDTIARILEREPDWRALPATTPLDVRRLLQRCLEKDSRRRLRDIGDAMFLLDANRPATDLHQAVTSAGQTTTSAKRLASMTTRMLQVTAAAGIALAASALTSYVRDPATERPVQFSLVLDRTAYADLPRVSPDGSSLVYPAMDESGRRQLWLRRLDSDEPKMLAGTNDALYPFWSPDGRWVGFYAQRRLKKISVEGGSPQTIVGLPAFDGTAAWSATHEIVYAPGNRTSLYRISDEGGEPREFTKLDASRDENSHRHVRILPDGKRFLFVARSGRRDNNALYSASIESGEIRRLAPIQSNAAYIPSGGARLAELVFARDDVLFRQRFDGSTLSGEPMRFTDVGYRAVSMLGFFDASLDGRVLLTRPPYTTEQRLTWFDRKGEAVGTLGAPGVFEQPKISPDGTRVIFNRPDDAGGNRDLWLIEVARGTASRLTTAPSNEWSAIWTSGGRHIAFASDRDGKRDGSTWEKTSMDPGTGEQPVTGLPEWANPEDWSQDGKWILFSNGAMHGDVWVASTERDGKPLRFFDSGFEDRIPRFSPDGKWLAYHSNETGRFEVYVRRFEGKPAGSGQKIRISLQGGFYATWSGNGRELFFIGPDSKLYVVPVVDLGRSNTAPTPRALFDVCSGNTPTGSATQGSNFDVSADGQRFLFSCATALPNKYIVSVNWQSMK